MSLSNLIRRRVHSVTVLCRHGSSTATRKPQRKFPDEKLRALVSLYHQADNFITMENLSQRIDEAFTAQKPPPTNTNIYYSLKSMEEIVQDQRKEPRVTGWNRETAVNQSDEYYKSSRGLKVLQRKREMRVKQALYGLDEKEGNVPGLGILQDIKTSRWKRLKRQALELQNDEKDEGKN